MNNEQWDYKIDGKINAITKIVIFLVISAIFVVLTIDQLQAQPNKSLIMAFSFGSIAVISLYFLIKLLVRYFCFKVYIGSEGFYFQSNPFNGKYYEYLSIKSCREVLKTNRPSTTADIKYFYFFIFTEKSGRSTKFLFEKPVFEREINALRKLIENG